MMGGQQTSSRLIVPLSGIGFFVDIVLVSLLRGGRLVPGSFQGVVEALDDGPPVLYGD